MHGQSELLGRSDVIIAADGAIVGLMCAVGGGTIPMLSYTGRLTGDRPDADYGVISADGREASASRRLEKLR
jgi:hypothetical protein